MPSPPPISSYRLGDLVLVTLTPDERQELKRDHPSSLGAEFIDQMTANPDADKIATITALVVKRLTQHAHLLPLDIGDSNVLHVRLGDVVAGHASHEKLKRPLDIPTLAERIPPHCKTYVIGQCFFARPSSTNYEECFAQSHAYLDAVQQAFHAEHFDGGSADIDLYCAVQSRCFIQGRGYFSKLIVEIRRRLSRPSMETEAEC